MTTEKAQVTWRWGLPRDREIAITFPGPFTKRDLGALRQYLSVVEAVIDGDEKLHEISGLGDDVETPDA